MKKLIPVSVLCFIFGMQNMQASVQTEIENANKAGNAVFLVVSEPGNADEGKAKTLAKEAQAMVPNSSVIQMNKADKANAVLVQKYQLTSVQLPVILVIASNGAIAGGKLFSEATSQNISELVPSAGKAQVLKSIQEEKPVFLVVSKKSHLKKDVLSKCKDACTQMKDNAKVVEIDFDDSTEKKFLSDLKITKIENEPLIYVINSGGQVANSYSGVTDVKTLTTSATKKSGGCCPPGSNKSCSPEKK